MPCVTHVTLWVFTALRFTASPGGLVVVYAVGISVASYCGVVGWAVRLSAGAVGWVSAWGVIVGLQGLLNGFIWACTGVCAGLSLVGVCGVSEGL